MFPDTAGAVQLTNLTKVTAQDETASSLEVKDLVLRAQAGDISAFEQLMICHQKQVLSTAARILRRFEDAKDATQEVFLKLYRYLPRIKPEAVRTWLYRVTITVCHDMARKNERLPAAALEGEAAERDLSGAAGDSIGAGIDLREQRQILFRALQSLPLKERAALVLRDIEELSTEEVARILGSSATTVRSQISSARVKVRRYCERVVRREK